MWFIMQNNIFAWIKLKNETRGFNLNIQWELVKVDIMLIAIFISAEFHVKRCWIQEWLERVDLYENEIVSGENALLGCHLSKGVMENANCPDFYGDMELKTLWGVQSETCTTTVKSPLSHPLSITIKFLSITRKDLTRGMGLATW